MRLKPLFVIVAIIIVTIALIFATPYAIVFWYAWTTDPFMDKTPEELFEQFVLDDDNLQSPSKFDTIEGVEVTQFFVPLKGPVYIRFKADDTFINALINRNSQAYERYVDISCDCRQTDGIRYRVHGSKRFNRMMSSWAFRQLIRFVQYKAERLGIRVIFVDPRRTSRTCRKCGHSSRSNRPTQSQFRCVKCNHQDNADGNASGNIADRGALLSDQGAL